MGYYKNVQIAEQADVDRMIAWYKASGKHLPAYLHEWLLERDERVWGAIRAWEKQPVPFKPASEHVALQVAKTSRKEALWLERNKPVMKLSRTDYRVLLTGIIALGVIAVASVIIVVGV